MNLLRHRQLLAALLAGLLVSCGGCSSLPLPAIDPTGERIFLPSPSYTTFVTPYDSANVGLTSCLPQSAFPEPPPIPACTDPPPPYPGGTGVGAATQDRLVLSPAKIVAPVNSEVVLLAGLCGHDGYFVTKQPIEWMLSPDSVGNIIGLADSAHPRLAKLAHHSPHKECNNLALTRTCTNSHVVNRGTAALDDDVRVGKGQTWISVSSPTEGVSYVTALAKSVENWETRRQTAMIYWVDMQWAFPSPQIVRAGQPCELSTVVTKTSSGNPAAKAVVNYEVIGGSPAFFGPGRTSLRVPTDENGRAVAQLFQDPPGPGSTQVRVQIYSATAGADNGSQVVIGQGFTTVTWSAPGLTVRATGPQTVGRGGLATYHVEVSNPGDIITRGARLRVELPASFRYLNSQPSAQTFGNGLEWTVGDLSPKQTQTFQVNCQAGNSGEYQLLARALSADVAEARSLVQIRVIESGLSVRLVDPPTTAIVGGRVEFNFEVTNTGGLPLSNLVVRDTFDAGLEPAYPNTPPNRPLELVIESLSPGQTVQRGLAFNVRRAGQLCHTLEVNASGGAPESVRACITATQPVLKVDVRKVGPLQAQVGEGVRFVINVTNSGEGVLTNLQIADIPDQNLQPDQGTYGLEKVGNTIVWRVGTLSPGQTDTREVVCICRTAAAAARNVVEVTADGGVREMAAAEINIQPAPEPPVAPITPPATPPMTPPTTPPGKAGQLGLQVAHLGDPQVGDTATFLIFVRNLNTEPDQDVQLTVYLPPEFTNPSVSRDSLRVTVTPVAGGISIGPIREVRGMGQETLPPIKINANASKAGRYTIKVKAESRRAPAVETEAEINVIAR